MTKKLCRLLGVGLLLVGALGFAQPHLLGMHLTPIHNVIHLVSGALALYFASASPRQTRAFCLVFGTVYMLLGVLGLVAPDVVARVIGHGPLADARSLMPDNLVHIVVGGAFVLAALAGASLAAYPPRKTTA